MNAEPLNAQVNITPFDWPHHDGLIKLVSTIQQRELDIPITPDAQPDLQDPVNFFRVQGRGEFWIAAAPDGTVVGCSGLIYCGDHIVVLRKMFVHADWRGKPYGIAQQLLDASIAFARGRKSAKILLGTIDKFHAAHRFYERNGFELIQPETLPPEFPRMAVDNRFYQLQF
jgi:N-acetylglutamate synthase-like GNAT family acetyltransferase